MKRALDVSRFIWKENTIASNAVNQTIKKLCVLLGFLDSQKIREATTADFFRIGRTFLILDWENLEILKNIWIIWEEYMTEKK